MKRIYLYCLLALLAAVALVTAIEYDPGYVLITYGLYSLETSVWVALAIFSLVFVVIVTVVSFIRKIFRQGNQWGQWFSNRSQRRTTDGFIAFIEGNWERSRRVLARSAEGSETPLLNYLFAARASNELKDDKKTRQFLKSAEQSTAGASIAVGLAQAEMELQNGRYEQCLATLMRLRRNTEKHPYVLKLLKSVYLGLNDWTAMADILPELKKYKLVASEELLILEVKAAEVQLNNVTTDISALKSIWKQLPRHLTRNGQLVVLYARLLIANGDGQAVESVLRHQLKLDWQRPLIDLYGRIEGEDSGKLLLFAEGWLKERNNDSGLLLCLGRLSIRNELWGKARDYFESSLKLEKHAETFAELGRLLSFLDEHEKSNEYFHQGLLVGMHDLPDFPELKKDLSLSL
jgi:HemY protein